jgi:hypothetical protein
VGNPMIWLQKGVAAIKFVAGGPDEAENHAERTEN